MIIEEEAKYINIYKYWQKSKILLPLVDSDKKLKKFVNNTYLFCDDLDESILDGYLLCEVSNLKEKIELDNLVMEMDTDKGTKLLILDTKLEESDIENFIQGKYSKLSFRIKKLIVKYYYNGNAEFKDIENDILKGEVKGYAHFYCILFPNNVKEKIIEDLVNHYKLFDNIHEAEKALPDELVVSPSIEKETFKNKII